jgi:hypothetical protein
MKKKLSLELEALSIESFDTTSAARDARGTVRGNDSEGDDPQPTPPLYIDVCTCRPTDLCKTAAYHCATAPHTAVSCEYTYNGSCHYE